MNMPSFMGSIRYSNSVKTTAPPEPRTRTPKFLPPALACDAHCHVFGPAEKFPYAPDAPYCPPDAPFERLQRLHKTLRIERAVIVHASCHGADMRVTLDAIARSNGRYRGTAIIDESHGDREFQKMHEGGIRGVRFNFVKHLGGLPEMSFFKKTIETAPERILWGTDWPHPNVGKHMPNDGDLVDLFAQMAPEPALQHKILVDNPARLYGF